MLWSAKLNKTTFVHPLEEKAIERKPFVEVISGVYVRDDLLKLFPVFMSGMIC
jgi:hypothetical protein